MGEAKESRGAIELGLVAAVAGWLVARTLARVIAAWAFSTDDAFITLRYARHLLEGEGLAWNVGEGAVEGFSNLLWLLVAALFGALGELGVAPLKVLGCAGLFATGYLQWAIARRSLRPLPALLPFALFTLPMGTIWWSVSGLETSVHVALCCAAVLAGLRGLGFERVHDSLSLRRGSTRPSGLVLAGGLAGLDSLLRPEGPLVFAALLVGVFASWLAKRQADHAGEGRLELRPALLALSAVFVPIFLAVLAWRVATFDALVPNSVACKAGWDDRFALLREYWRLTPLCLVVALIQPLRSIDARVVIPAAFALLYALILIGADPVAGGHLRHLLAAHALVCVLASVAAIRLAKLVAPRWPALRREAALTLVVVALAGPLGGLSEREQLEGRAGAYAERWRNRAALGRYLARELSPGERAMLGDVGVAGWVADAAILDAFCLNEPAFARPPLAGDPAASATWALDQQPQLIVVHTRDPDRLVPRGKIYRELIRRDRFKAGWREQARFVAKSGKFHYVVFRRVD